MSVNTLLARIIGAVYFIVGVLGVVLVARSATGEAHLLGFHVNTLHNIVHLAVGVALVAASYGRLVLKATLTTIGLVYLVVAIFGFGGWDWLVNLLELNTADNWLHLVSAVVLLFLAYVSLGNFNTGSSNSNFVVGGPGDTEY